MLTYQRLIGISPRQGGTIQTAGSVTIGYGDFFTPPGTANGAGRISQIQYGLQPSETFSEIFSYTPGGLVAQKRVTWPGAVGGVAELLADYTSDNEGRRTSVKYPDSYASSVLLPGPTFTSGFDAMGRPLTMTSGGINWVKGIEYNVAGQMKRWDFLKEIVPVGGGYYAALHHGEDRTYNGLGQLTGQRVDSGTTLDLAWTYSATQNNGKIERVRDGTETVTMTYDVLGRLANAAATRAGARRSLTTGGETAPRSRPTVSPQLR